MLPLHLEIAFHLLAALAAGSLIGLERSFHGRPAGFRTHALVCVASALLMVVPQYQSTWLNVLPPDAIRTDPTRMAQGIMTGIGFLGAGVIFKDGITVRGLTTAASIWMTAAIGILFGIGFYYPAILATLGTLGILSAFRWVESKMPGQYFAYHLLRFHGDQVLPEPEVLSLLGRFGFSVSTMSYGFNREVDAFEYRMVLMTADSRNASRLAEHLRTLDSLLEFRISPAGD